MSRWLVFFLFLCVALPAGGGGLAYHFVKRAALGDVSPPATFRGEKRAYTVTVPHAAAWAHMPRAPLKEGLGAVDMWLQHEKTRANVYVTAAVALDEKLSPLEYARYMTRSYATTYKSFAEHESTPMNGGLMLHMSGIENGAPVELLNAVIVSDGVLYSLIGATSRWQFPSMRADLESILRSFVAPPPDPTPTEMPKPALVFAAPPDPPRAIAGEDLYRIAPDVLVEKAEVAAGRGQFEEAIARQRAAVTLGHPGRVQLARYYARNRQNDAAFYWLQWAAREAGVPLLWAGGDDLGSLYGDPRWIDVSLFLRDAARWWASDESRTALVQIPRNYKRGTRIPVVLALHGYGSAPTQLGGEGFQDLADMLSVAYVSLPGSIRLGPNRFGWTEAFATDVRRVEATLAELEYKIGIGKIVLVGFSQGALVALQIAARDPRHYAGAIAMSPASLGATELPSDGPPLEGRRFMVLFGANEEYATHSEAAAATLRAAGADVVRKTTAATEHSYPPDFTDSVADWIRFVLEGTPRPK